MGIFSKLVPPDKKFYELFENVAVNLRGAADALERYAASTTPEECRRCATEIEELEHANDVSTHAIFSELHRSFIIPFDREDIHALASALDDILDYATYTVMRAVAYGVTVPIPTMRRQLGSLSAAIRSVCDIMERLRDLKNISEISPYLQEVHRIENEGDAAYMQALTELFAGEQDPIFIMKWKDLHRLAETAVNHCESAADVAEGIAIKHA